MEADDGKDADPGSSYGELTRQELVDLIDDRDKDKLARLGGVEGVARLLRSDVARGVCGGELEGPDVDRRLAAFGSNTFEYPPPKTLVQLMLEQLEDKTLQLLCFAAVISLVIGLAVECHRQDYGYAGRAPAPRPHAPRPRSGPHSSPEHRRAREEHGPEGRPIASALGRGPPAEHAPPAPTRPDARPPSPAPRARPPAACAFAGTWRASRSCWWWWWW